MRYIKRISTGRYYNGLSGGDPSKPEHLTHMVNEVVAGQGISADDLEAGYMDDAVYEAAMESQRLADMTYSQKRKTEYTMLNQFEMQFDDQRDGTSTWVDTINTIKGKYPKP